MALITRKLAALPTISRLRNWTDESSVMESKNDLTARVHEWLTRFGLCPEVPDEDGWMYVNYCGIPSDCKLYDDKVMFALDFAIQSDDFDFEACAEAALDLMEEFPGVQVILHEKENDDLPYLTFRVWVHELSDYERFEREFWCRMDQLIACFFKVFEIPAFKGAGDEDDSLAPDMNGSGWDRVRQAMSYLDANEIVHDYDSECSRIYIPEIHTYVKIAEPLICVYTLLGEYDKVLPEGDLMPIFSMMDLSGRCRLIKDDEGTVVVVDVTVPYLKDEEEDVFKEKLGLALKSILKWLMFYDENLQGVGKINVERMPAPQDGDMALKEKLMRVLRENGYCRTVEDGVGFEFCGNTFDVYYYDHWISFSKKIFVPKCPEYQDLPSFLFDLMDDNDGIKARIVEEESDEENWLVELSTELDDLSLNFAPVVCNSLRALIGAWNALLEHYVKSHETMSPEEPDAVCDFVFSCMKEAGYDPEMMTEDYSGCFLISHNEITYWVIVSPDGEYCRIVCPMENRSGYEFLCEARAAFTLMSSNTDVVVTHSEPDRDECEVFCLSEMFMLSDDKETFLSDLKSYLEDLERCSDYFINQVRQQQA